MKLGYEQAKGPDGKVTKETDIARCAHCPVWLDKVPGRPPGVGMCLKCMRPVCAQCAIRGMAPGAECVPYELQLDLLEKGNFPKLRELGIDPRDV